MAGVSPAEILRLVRDLSLSRDLDMVTAVLRDRARALVGSDGLTFIMREGDQVHYVEEDAIGPLWKGRRFPMTMCLSGWVIQRGLTVVISDIYQDARIPHEWYRPTFVRSVAMVPIGRPQPIAAIGAYWAVEREPSRDEVVLLEALAEAAALALSNVQLYAELNGALATARASNEEKDRLIAMVGHELRNPLAAAVAALDLMRLRPDRARGRKAREVVERQVRHMTRLVEEVLDLGRIAGGAVQVSRALLEVQAIVDGAIEVAEPAIRDGLHHFAVEVHDGGAQILGDQLRLQQMIANLLINASKYTPPGGNIRLTTRLDGDQLVIAVTDDGVGLTPEIAERVFEPFVRGESDREVTGGVGLGLSLVRQIVRLHGGTVEARSDGPGMGSEFVVRLPAASPQSAWSELMIGSAPDESLSRAAR